MPALFAYLIAVGLLLGGGYGALSWLAAPESVKVAVKVKPKATSPDETKSEAVSPETGTLVLKDNDGAAFGSTAAHSKESQPSQPSGSSEVTTERAGATEPQGAQTETSERTKDHQNSSVNAEVTHTEIKQPAEADSQAAAPQAVAPALSGSQQAAGPPATVAKTSKRRAVRQARGRPEQSGLVMMTLRTIEFPDGRRVTRLIPYRAGRALAYEPLE